MDPNYARNNHLSGGVYTLIKVMKRAHAVRDGDKFPANFSPPPQGWFLNTPLQMLSVVDPRKQLSPPVTALGAATAIKRGAFTR